MTTTDTMDTAATVAQAVRLVRAGCEIVRITAPTVEDARNLGQIRRALRAQGIAVPLVADIHFSPAAALEAAEHVEKVRINPGNFADSKRFAVREYSDAQYQAELDRLEARFAPLVEKCQARGVAMRIGTNHGSLSDRIMNRFGDTPLGMVESALEFARICARAGYHDLIFSMKASNPKVMIQAYRLLAARLDELGPDWAYPFHLGVTEAGNGEDGRIKSAIGIGSLLADGIGDTIRVSLTEEPEYEVPVAFALARPYQVPGPRSQVPGPRSGDGLPSSLPAPELPDTRNPYEYNRRPARPVALGTSALGGGQPVRVVHPLAGDLARLPRPTERALALAGADGLLRARPDALSLSVRTVEDAAALHRLRAALEAAGADLPLVVCVPPSHPALAAVAGDADMVSLHVGGAATWPGGPGAGESEARSDVDHLRPGTWDLGPGTWDLKRALATLARARRPVLLAATPDGAEADPAHAAAGAVTRLLAAAAAAEDAGCIDVALTVAARDTALSLRTYRLLAARLDEAGLTYPIHLLAWPEGDATEVLLRSSVLLGALLCDGIGDAVQILGDAGARRPAAPEAGDATRARLAFNVLQGAGVRLSKTEFVACPSCGRTLFDLQEATERIQHMTGHLKGLKIAIMGCIVNGPGEMADADFGYVGGAPGKVNLYVGKECVQKGLPADEADDRLIDLIRAHGKWVEPPAPAGQPLG
jgi:(E)-4-hydroxy-3-methylbut-2-enyl-diphosphate synthase